MLSCVEFNAICKLNSTSVNYCFKILQHKNSLKFGVITMAHDFFVAGYGNYLYHLGWHVTGQCWGLQSAQCARQVMVFLHQCCQIHNDIWEFSAVMKSRLNIQSVPRPRPRLHVSRPKTLVTKTKTRAQNLCHVSSNNAITALKY